jgi:hypothetical protein
MALNRNRYWDVVNTVMNLILLIHSMHYCYNHNDQQMHIIGFIDCT